MPITKVYAVENRLRDIETEIKGVFSTKKKAEEYLQKSTEGSSEEWKKQHFIKTYQIDELENMKCRKYWQAQCEIGEAYINIIENPYSSNICTIFNGDYAIMKNKPDYILVNSYISSKHARGIIIKLLEERENKQEDKK